MLITLTYKTTQILLSSLFNKTSESLYSNIRDIVYYNPELQILIEKHDIEQKIRLFKQFLLEFNNQYKSKTIYVAIENVYHIILIINSLLKKIKYVLKEHTKKIFSKYRKPDYGDKLQKLDIYCNLLNERFNLLYKINNIIGFNTDDLTIDDKLINYNQLDDPELSYILIPEQTHNNNN